MDNKKMTPAEILEKIEGAKFTSVLGNASFLSDDMRVQLNFSYKNNVTIQKVVVKVDNNCNVFEDPELIRKVFDILYTKFDTLHTKLR